MVTREGFAQAQRPHGHVCACVITSSNYDYLLGGKDNYATDRQAVRRLLKAAPEARDSARANRAFLRRAVRFLVGEAGIGQIIDVGTGIPAAGNVHEVAAQVAPGTRVAYVDTDPVVLAHGRALLATGDGVTAVAADLRDPAAVLADPGLRAVIDPARPVAVLLGAVLHFLGADAARQVTPGYAQVMAPGSCLVISVARYDDETLGKQAFPRKRLSQIHY